MTIKQFMKKHGLKVGDYFALSNDFDSTHNNAVYIIQEDYTLDKMFGIIFEPIKDDEYVVCGYGLSGLSLTKRLIEVC